MPNGISGGLEPHSDPEIYRMINEVVEPLKQYVKILEQRVKLLEQKAFEQTKKDNL